MDAVLDPIIRSPRFSMYMKMLAEYSADEAQRRERFYDEITEDQKAEFINGEMTVQSPAKHQHGVVAGHIYKVLGTYAIAQACGHVACEQALVCLTRNDYEPDVCFFRKEVASTIVRGQMRYPAPDLVIEVLSPSTEHIDRGVKFEDYAAHGVTEYWIVDPDAETIEQYLLADGAYGLALKVRDGAFDSVAMPGLRFPVRAAFDDEACLAALREILLSSEERLAGSE